MSFLEMLFEAFAVCFNDSLSQVSGLLSIKLKSNEIINKHWMRQLGTKSPRLTKNVLRFLQSALSSATSFAFKCT